jgi:hypothetical protein
VHAFKPGACFVLLQAFGFVLAAALLSLLEAFTSQIDNLVLPPFALTLFNMAYRFAADCGRK